MTEFNLFPAEDTIIKCNTPDGKSIEVDAMDIDTMLAEVYVEKQVSTMPLPTMLSLMIEKFEATYGFRMSKRSMDLLLEKRAELLDIVKKNTFQSSELSEPTESSPLSSPEEN